MMKTLTCTLLLLASLAHGAPTADELIAKATEAAGGKEKLAKVTSLTMKATISVPAQNLNGTIDLYKTPGNILILTTIPGIGEIRAGLTGDVAYEQTDLLGARLLSEKEKAQMLQGMESVEQFDRLAKLKGVKVTGPEKIDDADAWKISGVNQNDDAEEYWIDVEKFRIVRTKMIVQHQMGRMEAVMSFSDFKTTDGLEMPMTTRTQMGPGEIVMQITKMEFNPVIDEAKFALPVEVKKLVAKQKSKPATQPATRATTQPAPKEPE